MASWSCSDHNNSAPSASEQHGCVPMQSVCAVQQQRQHLCVAGGAWTTVDDSSSSRPAAAAGPACPQGGSSCCAQRHMGGVHTASPYMDAGSDAVYCRASRFPTSAVSVDTSLCHTSATSHEPSYNPGMSTRVSALQQLEYIIIIINEYPETGRRLLFPSTVDEINTSFR